MSTEKRTKLNQLIQSVPTGTCATTAHFVSLGYSHHLLHSYEHSGWLEFLERGAFIRKGDRIDWMGGLYAIQQQLKKSVHAGGKTALSLRGHSHFVSRGKETIHLFGAQSETLPQWFSDHDWNVGLSWVPTNLFERAEGLALTQYDRERFSIQISTPERAMMELLHLVPQEQSVEEARLLMQKLSTLRPKVIQDLLGCCGSVKVKRLFMVFAEECRHGWVQRLDLKKVDFGKGKRSIGAGGVFNAKYEISLPEKQSEV